MFVLLGVMPTVTRAVTVEVPPFRDTVSRMGRIAKGLWSFRLRTRGMSALTAGPTAPVEHHVVDADAECGVDVWRRAG
jgi:hypothetical protein